MRTVAIANFKGGSGKSTTTVNLAAALAELGQRVLVIDLDGLQGSATKWLGIRDSSPALVEALIDGGSLSEQIAPATVDGVDVIAACPWLTERRLAGEQGAEMLLGRAIQRLRGPWQFLLVDTPPGLGVVSTMALAGCHELLAPVEARYMALAGMASMLPMVEKVRDRMNTRLRLSAVLPCRVDRTLLARSVVEKLRGKFGSTVMTTVIRENVRLAEAPSFAKPITVYAPDSIGAADYRAAAREFIEKEKAR